MKINSTAPTRSSSAWICASPPTTCVERITQCTRAHRLKSRRKQRRRESNGERETTTENSIIIGEGRHVPTFHMKDDDLLLGMSRRPHCFNRFVTTRLHSRTLGARGAFNRTHTRTRAYIRVYTCTLARASSHARGVFFVC